MPTIISSTVNIIDRITAITCKKKFFQITISDQKDPKNRKSSNAGSIFPYSDEGTMGKSSSSVFISAPVERIKRTPQSQPHGGESMDVRSIDLLNPVSMEEIGSLTVLNLYHITDGKVWDFPAVSSPILKEETWEETRGSPYVFVVVSSSACTKHTRLLRWKNQDEYKKSLAYISPNWRTSCLFHKIICNVQSISLYGSWKVILALPALHIVSR